jgi:endoglucanase
MERLAPPATGITGPFDALYLGNLTQTVNYITGKGAYVLIEREHGVHTSVSNSSND